jgi:CelD/BcsL family acetyltransferase involved in cellulose biosynthesis
MKPSVTLKVRVLHSLAELREISSEWRELFEHSHAAAFQSPDWLLPWIEVFAPEKITAVEVRCGERLVGLAPFLIYRREAERVLAFMGGGVSDYLDVLIDPKFQAEIMSQIIATVCGLQDDWTVLDLTDLPAQSPLLRLVLLKREAREHDSCSVLCLPDSKDQLLHLFSKRQRASLRNARSRLQRAGGGEIELATAQNVSEFLPDLFRLHTSRWSERGQPGVLSDPRTLKFHRSCAAGLFDSGLLRLSRLRLHGKTLAVIYSLFAHETAFCYLQGFDPEFAWLSPGTQLMYQVIGDALDHGIRGFDFLRGNEDYKQHWRPESQPTYRIRLARSSLSTMAEFQRVTDVHAA